MIVLLRKTNQNYVLANKKTQRNRLHMMCRAILTYSNVEEILFTDLMHDMKDHEWPLQDTNNI